MVNRKERQRNPAANLPRMVVIIAPARFRTRLAPPDDSDTWFCARETGQTIAGLFA